MMFIPSMITENTKGIRVSLKLCISCFTPFSVHIKKTIKHVFADLFHTQSNGHVLYFSGIQLVVSFSLLFTPMNYDKYFLFHVSFMFLSEVLLVALVSHYEHESRS